MPLTAADFDRVTAKLHMRIREGKHRFAFLDLGGEQVLWTMRSQGRGELGRVEHTIRRQLKVSSKQLRALADCPMTRGAYIKHLKDTGVITEAQFAQDQG